MATFKYQGRNNRGGQVKGLLESPNANTAAAQLAEQQIIITKLEETKDANKATIVSSMGDMLDLIGLDAIQIAELINFCRQMNALMRSGVPILQAIKGLSVTSSGVKLKQALVRVADLLEGGYPLSAAFSKEPKVFNSLFISIIHVGENTGELDNAFLKLSVYFEREEQTSKRIKTAMRYPTFVLIVLLMSIVAINIFVIPTFTSVFAKLGADLPATTKFLIQSSKMFIEYGLHGLVVSLAFIVVVRSYLQTKVGAYIWARGLLKMPILGSIFERTILARFTYSLSTVLKSGVPMTTALSLVAEAVDNAYMRRKILAMRVDVESGITLYKAAANAKLFTPLVLQMIAVGDESGRVAELLEDVGDYYEREVDYDLGALTAKIEPVLIVVVAGMVLVMGLGIFEPMWNMNDALNKN